MAALEGRLFTVVDPSFTLAEMVDWQGAVSAFQDWQTVEDALGVRLPGDYKMFMERFSSGLFRGLVGLDNPIEGEWAWDGFRWDFFDTLDRARAWRDHDPEVLPHPIFPEPGGVIPWGGTNANHRFFWLPLSDDPDEWIVVFSTADFGQWGEFPGGMSKFVLELVSGDFRSQLIVFSGESSGSLYGPTGVQADSDAAEVGSATSPDPGYWDRPSSMRELSPGDHGRVAEIVSLSAVDDTVREIDWHYVEDRLSLSLPTDYKRLVESVGAGDLLGIKFFSPAATDPAFNLYANLARIHDSADRARAASRQFRFPVFPDIRGMLAWGSFVDESGDWILAWAPLGDDPDRWPIVAVPFEFGSMRIFSRSMSELLLGYIRRESGEISMLPASAVELGDRPIFVSAQ
ncbi:SMI1/KNR4 family protein [Crossiella sp. CA198]|uniref:SMI1/KNR4 family protein n=1 Tax=Crossiella sp. CA198 TaxID=3455607 RepID=UPI003F8D82AF